MKIFDGVTVNPNNLNPTLQGVLGVAMLFAGTLVEADKVRQQRAAKAKEQATTLEDVMEQSGLDIPRLEDALTKFMGGSPEAKEAASFIARAPDPVKLLRHFAQEFTAASPSQGPIVTPPPAATDTTSSADPPGPSSASSPATPPTPTQFRPEFTREGMTAANAAPPPRAKPAQFRPEFTREGMAAAQSPAPTPVAPAPAAAVPAATTASQPAKAASPHGASSSPATANTFLSPPCIESPASTVSSPTSSSSAARTPSLADALVRRLAARDRRIEAHQAELETHVRCVEAELALLREEVQEVHRTKDCPMLFLLSSTEPLPSQTLVDAEPLPVVPDSTADEITDKAEVDTADTEAESTPTSPREVEHTEAAPAAAQVPAEPTTVDEPTPSSQVPGRREDMAAESAEVDTSIPPPSADGEEALPPPTSEADLVRAVEILDEFSERTEADYMRQIERVKGMGGEVKLLRALVAHELVARQAVSHG